ncbi:MAG TPA: SUMF1/EgtB/PvdO family nonheme iron enzyme [Prolixibacteraceae bacterium]|jgi:formylglycine-generating enzyme required for sulfatase activity
MKRRIFLKGTLGTVSLLYFSPLSIGAGLQDGKGSETYSTDSPDPHQPDLIPVPDQPESWIKFQELLFNWRKEAKARLNYDDTLYNNPDFQWVSSAYNCYFLMMYDQRFYNSKEGKYTVDQFVSESEKEFGRLDIVVLWHAYPRIGLDDRNQFDFYHQMPGGLTGLKNVSDQLHSRGVKVYINYNPWDTGTKRENTSDIDNLSQIVHEIGADGIFLDTLNHGSNAFREKLDQAKHGVVLESELALPIEDIHNHHMSWAQWFGDSQAPGILRNKWLERRHIQHGISRWERDRTKELHTAWMNGSGIMIWENVFGQWVGWNERDKSILRSMSPIQKRYTSLFSGEGWLPMSDETPVQNVYTNRWYDDELRLWTLVNRSESTIESDLLSVDKKDGDHYYDLIQGKEVIVKGKNGKVVLSGKIAPRGIACFIAGKPGPMGNDFQLFLSKQAELFKKWNPETSFPALQAKRVLVMPTKRTDKPLAGMVEIPSFKGKLEVDFRVREVGFYSSVDPYFINCGAPRLHQNTSFTVEVNLPKFLMDEAPVTNYQYQQFLKESGYVPKVALNFLKHWDNGQIPSGKEDHPVVYVSLDDARAYAAWAGKRLPTEQEWQFAGQGNDNKKYPWGEKMENGYCNSGESGGTTAVKAYPKGISVFGCYDLCGNTWEMTESEYSDGRSRFCILKGGSFYKAKGSDWYSDGGPQALDFAAKQLLMYPGIDRCSTIGFRCAADRWDQ